MQVKVNGIPVSGQSRHKGYWMIREAGSLVILFPYIEMVERPMQ